MYCFPGRKVYVLIKLWQNHFEVDVVEISQYNKKCIGVCSLLFTDGVVQFIQSLLSISTGWDIHSHKSNAREFPRQIEWPALKDLRLYSRGG